jgi:hypothetical protein
MPTLSYDGHNSAYVNSLGRRRQAPSTHPLHSKNAGSRPPGHIVTPAHQVVGAGRGSGKLIEIGSPEHIKHLADFGRQVLTRVEGGHRPPAHRNGVQNSVGWPAANMGRFARPIAEGGVGVEAPSLAFFSECEDGSQLYGEQVARVRAADYRLVGNVQQIESMCEQSEASGLYKPDDYDFTVALTTLTYATDIVVAPNIVGFMISGGTDAEHFIANKRLSLNTSGFLNGLVPIDRTNIKFTPRVPSFDLYVPFAAREEGMTDPEVRLWNNNVAGPDAPTITITGVPSTYSFTISWISKSTSVMVDFLDLYRNHRRAIALQTR